MYYVFPRFRSEKMAHVGHLLKPKNKKKSGRRVKKGRIKKENKAKIENIGIGNTSDLKF